MTSAFRVPQARQEIVPIRPYQADALTAIEEARSRGVTRQLVSMPTGSGKTFLAAHLIQRMGMRAAMLVHRDELVRQTERQFSNINPNLSIGVVKADRDGLNADVIIVSAQTLAHRRRLDRFIDATKGAPLLFIADEAHHDVAPSRRRAIEESNPALLVGLTATPSRGDKQGLDAIYEEIVYHLPILDLIRARILAPLRGLRIETEVVLDDVHTRGGEFVENELGEAVNQEARNRLIVQSWKKYASDRKRTVAFCVNVAHATELASAFRHAGIDAETILGTTPTEDRARMLAAFRDGKVPVLTNCLVLTEGYDEPAIDCILMCRPTKSPGLYIQCVGRGARQATQTGKRDCLVIDYVDVSSRHSLVTLPTLVGEEGDRPTTESVRVEGEIIDFLELADAGKALKERRAVAVDLFGGSPVIWQPSHKMFFAVASAGREGSTWTAVIPDGDGYVPVVIRQARGARPSVERLFDRAVDAEMARGIAESKVEKSPLTDRNAGWRQKEEFPTEPQLKFARSLRVRIPPGATKVDVSGMIDEALFAKAARELRLVPAR